MTALPELRAALVDAAERRQRHAETNAAASRASAVARRRWWQWRALPVVLILSLGGTAAALAAVGVSDAVLIERKPDESHLPAVHAELLKRVRGDMQFVLAGKATSIQSVRNALTSAGVGKKRMKAKAYWAPGKIGLD